MTVIEDINNNLWLEKPQFDNLLAVASKNSASEISVSTDMPILAAVKRKYGVLTKRRIPTTEIENLVTELYGPEAITTLNSGVPLDKAYELKINKQSQRFRINVTPISKTNRRGLDLTCRLIRSTPPTLTEVGLTEEDYQLYDSESGINVISGPMGSGKTTSQAAFRRRMIEGLASSPARVNDTLVFNKRKILEYGAPIEYVFDHVEENEAFLVQSEIGTDLPTFADAPSNAVRRFAQVIEFTETKDPLTAIQIPDLGGTGHLFTTTFHGSDIGNTLGRFILLFPTLDRPAASHSLLAEMNYMMCQRLVPTIDGSVMALRETLKFTKDIKTFLQRFPIDQWAERLNQIVTEQKQDFRSAALRLLEVGVVHEEILDAIRG